MVFPVADRQSDRPSHDPGVESENKTTKCVAKEPLVFMIGFLINGMPISIAVLQPDYYGMAYTIVMALSVLVRMM
jgi:hypothetical protein